MAPCLGPSSKASPCNEWPAAGEFVPPLSLTSSPRPLCNARQAMTKHNSGLPLIHLRTFINKLITARGRTSKRTRKRQRTGALQKLRHEFERLGLRPLRLSQVRSQRPLCPGAFLPIQAVARNQDGTRIAGDQKSSILIQHAGKK